jgi:glucose-1-phosphate thymidylyltransferase
MAKVLLNVAGKPIIAHILDKLVEYKIDEVTIVVGYLGEQIKEYVSSHYSLKVDFVDQEERLGLGHAIYLSRHTMSHDPIFIILGDTIFDFNLQSVLSSKQSSLGVKYVEDPRRFGVAELDGDHVQRLVEKPEQPKSHLALVGLYYIKNPTILIDALKEMIKGGKKTKGEFQLTDALQMMIDRGEKFSTFPVDGWYDCGKTETLLETNRVLLTKDGSFIPQRDVLVIPPVFISPRATVHNCVIGPYVTIAEDANVQECILKNSIVCEGASVSNGLFEDSIVGNNALIQGSYKRVNLGDSSELVFQ